MTYVYLLTQAMACDMSVEKALPDLQRIFEGTLTVRDFYKIIPFNTVLDEQSRILGGRSLTVSKSIDEEVISQLSVEIKVMYIKSRISEKARDFE